jgi:hypothetical protein
LSQLEFWSTRRAQLTAYARSIKNPIITDRVTDRNYRNTERKRPSYGLVSLIRSARHLQRHMKTASQFVRPMAESPRCFIDTVLGFDYPTVFNPPSEGVRALEGNFQDWLSWRVELRQEFKEKCYEEEEDPSYEYWDWYVSQADAQVRSFKSRMNERPARGNNRRNVAKARPFQGPPRRRT